MPDPVLLVAVAFATAVTASYLIVHSVDWHLPYTADAPGGKPQKFHVKAVPRIGGAGVFIGMLGAGCFALLALPSAEFALYWLLVLSLLPAFCGGLAEDLTGGVGPGARLLLTVLTGAFAYSLAGVHFERSDVGWLDAALAVRPLGYLALLLAVAGVAQAINIIDGYNGLAGGVAAIVLASLAYVAQQHGDSLVATLCGGAAAAAAGFLCFNYPSGRLFLGDCGAYLLGCTIALGSALLVLRNPGVSSWFPLALVIYPVWETLFSAARRVLLDRRISEPDARHLHSLVYRRLSRRWVRGRRKGDKARRNSLTTLPFWLVTLATAVIAVHWAGSTRVQQGLIVMFVAAYCLAYWRLPHPRPGRRAREAGKMPAPAPAD